MATKVLPDNQPRCSHCGGTLIRDDGERKCLSCSRVWKTNAQLHEFYESHRAEILKDLAELGRPAATAKWQIPASSLAQLLKAWLGSHKTPAAAPVNTSSNHHLPEMPAFSDKWTPEVMIKWLETYQSLATTSKR